MNKITVKCECSFTDGGHTKECYEALLCRFKYSDSMSKLYQKWASTARESAKNWEWKFLLVKNENNKLRKKLYGKIEL